MRIKVIASGKTILSDGALIEARAYGRIADILEGHGINHRWEQEGHEGVIYTDKQQGDALGKTLLNDVQLTTNFNLSEFECKRHCQAVKIDPELARRLQRLRDEAGVPLVITSGYRCPEHNKNVGGASNSQHLYGTAADLKSKLPPTELHRMADKIFSDGGLGLYSWGIHVDTRGEKARWTS